jgi:fibronectin type 3 domain-containing protein
VDGSAVTTLRQVDVYRLAEDEGRGESPALPEEEYLKRAVRILSIPVSRFSDYLHDKTFRIEDRPSAPKASVKDSTAFRYAVLFVNKRNQAAGFSNQAVIRPVSIPSPPTVISAEVAQDLIRLKWLPPSENMDGSRPARIAGYNIYRSEDPSRFSSTPVNPEPVLVPAYDDRDFQFDKTYHYAVSVVGSVINPYAESHLSDVFSTVTRDIFPPLPPQEFTAIANGDNVVLLWGASESPDVAGYRVYRVEEGATAGQPLQNELITALSCRDLRSGGKGRYSIVAVDTHGNESAPVLTAVENP